MRPQSKVLPSLTHSVRWNGSDKTVGMKKGIFCRTENKAIFCHTKNVAVTPKSHMPTTSLWGVAAKWPTQALKMKLILCPRDPQAVSVWACQAGFWKSTGTSWQLRHVKSHSLKCSLHKWAWCGAARNSAHLNCINLIHFHLTAGRLRGRHCYTWGHLQIVTVCGNTVGRHS